MAQVSLPLSSLSLFFLREGCPSLFLFIVSDFYIFAIGFSLINLLEGNVFEYLQKLNLCFSFLFLYSGNISGRIFIVSDGKMHKVLKVSMYYFRTFVYSENSVGMNIPKLPKVREYSH